MDTPGFDRFPQPASNDADSVQAALDALRDAHDETTAVDACDALLWAVGDNDAGTYHPLVLGVLPALEQILLQGRPWAQRATMEALIDLGGTFAPAPGLDTWGGSRVRDALTAFVLAMRGHVAPLATSDGARAATARELLELMDDLGRDGV